MDVIKRSQKFRLGQQALLLVVVGLLAACNQQTVTTIQPGAHIPWTEVSGDDLSHADSIHWRDVPVFQIDLSPAPPVHASVQLRQPSSMKILPLRLQVASDGSRLLLRLVWLDESPDTQDAWDQFADGAAIQFALENSENTTHMMGAKDYPVNIWYWNAANQQVQNLAAEGFGGTTRLPDQNVTAEALYDSEQKEWQLVFARSLTGGGDHTALLGESNEAQLAFAVWQGASGQRDGDKRTSTGWITLGHSVDRVAAVTE